MTTKLKHIILKKPVFLFLLPVFFVWHGYVEFYDLISPSKAVILIFYYLAGTTAVFLLSLFFFKKTGKAALFSFFLMCLYFFFGSLQDFLLKRFPGSFINKYSFILSLLFLVFVFLFIYIKKTKGSLTGAFTYLNILLFVLLLFDSASLIKKIIVNYNIMTASSEIHLTPCGNCEKPDIYMILADGYSGKIPLQRFFQYDNSGFEDQLKKRKFYVVDSSFSNYNYTLFSMGSMFNIDYLKIAASFQRKTDLPIAFKAIRKSLLIKFLEKESYDVFNYSIFDIENHPSLVQKTLMNFEKNPITTQTFLYRLNRDIGYHLITTLKLKFLQQKERTTLFDNLDNNLKLDSLTKNIATAKSSKPKFVYTHLVMPHWPYYFDSSGNKTSATRLTDAYNFDKNSYISYLKFTNKKLLELIDQIQTNNSRPAIILLMGDHGFREEEGSEENKNPEYTNKYQFFNLNAIFLPDQNYNGFYSGMSNVNQFRVILNSQFGQHLAMLKDSVTIIKQ